jgi:hypothetical protein
VAQRTEASIAKAKPAKAQAKTQDAIKVDPKHLKVEVENKQRSMLVLARGG